GHRRGSGAAHRGVAGDPRREDPAAAADRPGRERSARQAGRVRADRRRDEAAPAAGDVRAVPRRGPRLRAPGEQHRVLRGRRGVPVGAPRRLLPPDHEGRARRVHDAVQGRPARGPGGAAVTRLAHLALVALAALAALVAACGGPAAPSAQEPAMPDPTDPASPDPEAPEPPQATGNPKADLIPRSVLFGNPERAAVRISPDGKHLSWLAPKD